MSEPSADSQRRDLNLLAGGFLAYAASLPFSYYFPGPGAPMDNVLLAAITPVAFMFISALGGPIVVLRERESRSYYTATLSRLKYLYPATYRSFLKFARLYWPLILGGFLLASGIYNLLFVCSWH